MTVSTATNVTTAAGDGGTAPVPIPFFFIDDADIEVTVRTDATGAETPWVLGTDFTVSGAGNEAGGTLTPISVRAVGTTLFIRRVEQFTQGSDFPAAGAIPSAAIEQALDRLTFLAQQLNETLGRGLTVPVTDGAASLALPSNIDRASKFLAFDGNGNPIAAAGTSANLGPVSAFMDTLLDDIDAAAARATLGIGGAATDIVEDLSPQLGAALDTNGFAVNESEGSAVASAATTDIWATDGNTIHVTGTATITGVGTAPRVGAWRKVIFDGALVLTHGANLNLPGSANITTAAGDVAFVYADTTTQFDVLHFKASGRANRLAAPDFTSSEQTVAADTVLNVSHGLGVTPSFVDVVLRNKTSELGYAVGEEVLANGRLGSSSADAGATVSKDSTDVTITQGLNFQLLSQSTLNGTTITVGNWKWVVRAWI
jgi:hypothetical protein